MVPQALVIEAENKAAEFQLGKMAAETGCPPRGWNVSHPCEFGVFRKGRDGYAVAPLFQTVFADMRRDGFRCIYRTDQGEV